MKFLKTLQKIFTNLFFIKQLNLNATSSVFQNKFSKNGYVLPENETTAKATIFLPLIIAILLLITLIFGLKLGENGAFMQRSKFCSVGAISKIFERDFSMFYGVISIIVCASITNLVLNQYKFGFDAQPFLFQVWELELR